MLYKTSCVLLAVVLASLPGVQCAPLNAEIDQGDKILSLERQKDTRNAVNGVLRKKECEEAVSIPQSATSNPTFNDTGVRVFEGDQLRSCSKMRSLVIGEWVKEIGPVMPLAAPIYTYSLIPTSHTVLAATCSLWTCARARPQKAFKGCNGLTSVTIGDSMTKIGRVMPLVAPIYTYSRIPKSHAVLAYAHYGLVHERACRKRLSLARS